MQCLRISSKTGDGVEKLWEKMKEHHKIMMSGGQLEKFREKQHKVSYLNFAYFSLDAVNM